MIICSFLHHFLLTLGLLLNIECIISLELVELHVPTHVPLGTRAHLSCLWQLGPAEVLYSVKWYKDGKEFFRHVPRDLEPRRKFSLPGVDVEESDASGSNITLGPVKQQTAGRYRCEVSGEGPLFPTVSDHADMLVVVLPDHGPLLFGFRPRYRIGDRVQVTCKSGRSQPATSLAWYVNGEPAAFDAVLPAVYQKHGDGLESTSLKLDFQVTEQHFRKSGFKVKCLATLSPVYWRSNEESALRERSVHDNIVSDYSSDEMGLRADRVRSSTVQLLINWELIFLLICCAVLLSF